MHEIKTCAVKVQEAFISALEGLRRLCFGDKLSPKGQEKGSHLAKDERRALQAEEQHVQMSRGLGQHEETQGGG